MPPHLATPRTLQLASRIGFQGRFRPRYLVLARGTLLQVGTRAVSIPMRDLHIMLKRPANVPWLQDSTCIRLGVDAECGSSLLITYIHDTYPLEVDQLQSKVYSSAGIFLTSQMKPSSLILMLGAVATSLTISAAPVIKANALEECRETWRIVRIGPPSVGVLLGSGGLWS